MTESELMQRIELAKEKAELNVVLSLQPGQIPISYADRFDALQKRLLERMEKHIRDWKIHQQSDDIQEAKRLGSAFDEIQLKLNLTNDQMNHLIHGF